MNEDLHLWLSDFPDEKVPRHKREAFLGSLVLHLLALILVVLGPQLIPTPPPRTLTQRSSELAEDSQRLGYLALPPDYQKLFQRLKPPAPHPRIQLPLPAPPKNDPKQLTAPPSENKVQSAEPSPKIDLPVPAASPASNPGKDSVSAALQPTTSGEGNKRAGDAQQASKQTEAGTAKSDLRDLVARLEVPGASIQSSLEQARKGSGLGYGGSGVGNASRIDNRMPDFSVDQPSILSDTRGVDFGPWLRLIYFRVRDNWYAVIPEVIRSGMKGRVVIIFDVQRNGKIENLEVARSSGLSSYDRAAISSLKLSEPLPGFPNAFSGDHISLQFTYLYNIRL
jgi:TonB family protein